MAIQNITMPQLGESVTEGTIEKWLVKPGDTVKKYDPLAEVVTDKVNAEIPSSFEGVITELLAQEGQTLPVGAVVCSIEIAGDSELPPPPPAKKSAVSTAILNAGVQKKQETQQPTTATIATQKTVRQDKVRYSPAVLRLAQEHDIALDQVTGTGEGGRITRKDLMKLIEAGNVPTSQVETTSAVDTAVQQSAPATQENTKSATSIQPIQAGDIEIPVTKVRRAIANNMVRSVHEVPHAWMMMEVDVTDLVAYRDSIKTEFKQKEGFNITYFAFFIKAVAQALKEFPMMNSMWAEDKIIQKHDINISIAVATDDALFVPVIKHADEKSIKGIAKEIHELAMKVRAGKLTMDDIKGGTFTVNNTGAFGSVQSMGIINYPQAAILQVENIVKKPVILPGGMFAARDIVNLCLSLDHRVLDGLVCGKFLNRVKEILENTNKSSTSVY
ncbi:2-oxo acid dehydrogenase subunit E2 [Lysinibacillus agricola]|uniref:Dihydrolipoamide acetyltransferase component of pyruvate dehydrogenase complex n=1 Tax=Lysinibacillus agricola TaxID=2590012 RepID=A0ABX7AYE5_9BACI|nr:MULTISPECIES: dihydrolipoamide acetyltransferase family protein [Lysinibacillus]KOS62554.1 branched-chain alpha-keto acid dehydrogenase subunit E2 [Lysinibacillus sp. FJAT-14222]QQP15012.1 2-oxo acid dehydrogenase subunit E2 [Lysinibacillus agricola]